MKFEIAPESFRGSRIARRFQMSNYAEFSKENYYCNKYYSNNYYDI